MPCYSTLQCFSQDLIWILPLLGLIVPLLVLAIWRKEILTILSKSILRQKSHSGHSQSWWLVRQGFRRIGHIFPRFLAKAQNGGRLLTRE